MYPNIIRFSLIYLHSSEMAPVSGSESSKEEEEVEDAERSHGVVELELIRSNCCLL